MFDHVLSNGMTRTNHSPEYVTLLSNHAPSFQQASDGLYLLYPQFLPELAKRVPLPPPFRPPTHLVARKHR